MTHTEVTSSALPAYTVVEMTAGVDWLSMTLPTENGTADLWAKRCEHVIYRIAAKGYDIKPRTMQGYYGISAGNCFIGERYDGYLMQLTGYHANEHFAEVYRPDGNVPRIDVQVTAKYDVMPTHIAREGYNNALLAINGLRGTRRRKLRLITGSDGGDTLYVGAPTSDQQGRLYNKEVQSEDTHFAKTWRYEVVYRNQLARECADTVASPARSRAETCRALVYRWFAERGVDNPSIDSGTAAVLPIRRTLPTDIEKQLHWLEKQVRPTIARLLEGGYRDTLIERLGLEQVIRPPEE